MITTSAIDNIIDRYNKCVMSRGCPNYMPCNQCKFWTSREEIQFVYNAGRSKELKQRRIQTMKTWDTPTVENLDVKKTETDTLGCWNVGCGDVRGDKKEQMS